MTNVARRSGMVLHLDHNFVTSQCTVCRHNDVIIGKFQVHGKMNPMLIINTVCRSTTGSFKFSLLNPSVKNKCSVFYQVYELVNCRCRLDRPEGLCNLN